MKLAQKLIGSFVLISAIGAAVSGVGIWGMSQINERDQKLYEMELQGISTLKQSTIEMLYLGRSVRNVIIAPSDERRAKSLSNIEKNFASLKSNLDKVESMIYTAKGRDLLNKLKGLLPQYEAEVQEIVKIAKNEGIGNSHESVEYLFGPFSMKVNELDKTMQELVSLKEANAKNAVDENLSAYHDTRILLIALSAFVLTVFPN